MPLFFEAIISKIAILQLQNAWLILSPAVILQVIHLTRIKLKKRMRHYLGQYLDIYHTVIGLTLAIFPRMKMNRLPTQNEAVVIHHFGGTNVLQVEEITHPIPNCGQFLVEVDAA